MTMPRALNGIGIKFFLDNFDFLYSRPSRAQFITYCAGRKLSNESGANIRYGYGMSIINNTKLLTECLEYIILHSKKSSNAQKNTAVEIMHKCKIK